MNNTFNIPPHLLLPSDNQQLESPCTEEEMVKLDSDIQEVMDRITAVTMDNFTLVF